MKPLVIFDCDGVLVDSESIASTVFADHLTAAGFPHTHQQCREKFTGLSLDSCRVLLEQESGKRLPEHFFRHLQAETYAAFAASLQAVPGVQAVLDFLVQQAWPFCVASSGTREKMAITLRCTGLRHYFGERIYSAADVARGKPAPDLFLHAASRESFSPAACVVVEDSPPGWQAAQAAGMRLCAYTATAATLPASGTAFACMSELPSMLLSLLEGRADDE